MSSNRFIYIGSAIFGVMGYFADFIYMVAEEAMHENGQDDVYDRMNYFYEPIIKPILIFWSSLWPNFISYSPFGILITMAPWVAFALIVSFSVRFLWRKFKLNNRPGGD